MTRDQAALAVSSLDELKETPPERLPDSRFQIRLLEPDAYEWSPRPPTHRIFPTTPAARAKGRKEIEAAASALLKPGDPRPAPYDYWGSPAAELLILVQTPDTACARLKGRSTTTRYAALSPRARIPLVAGRAGDAMDRASGAGKTPLLPVNPELAGRAFASGWGC